MLVRHVALYLMFSVVAGCGSGTFQEGDLDDPLAAYDSELTACLGPNRLRGIDVSEYQGTVDWKTVKATGNVFAYSRAAVGLKVDAKWTVNWAGMKSAGLIRGAYHFLHLDKSPEEQANLLVSTVGRLSPGDLPVMVDLEDIRPNTLTPAQRVDFIKRYIAIVQAGTGRKPSIYTSDWWWDPQVASREFGHYALTVAHYAPSCPDMPLGWTDFKIWQYIGDEGRTAGVVGPVDLDYFKGTLDDLYAFAGVAVAMAPNAAPPPCGALRSNQTLARGQALKSCNGAVTLAHQTDGHVVLYDQARGSPLWGSGTNGRATTTLAMQADGNLVLYNGSSAIWSTGTYGNPGAYLVLDDTGNATLRSTSNRTLWSTQTVVAPGCGGLPSGGRLNVNQWLRSCNGRYGLVLQADGNLVLYGPTGALWSTQTHGRAPGFVSLQADGNLVLLDSRQAIIWRSNTAGNAKSILSVQDDGNTVLYAPGWRATWSTGTSGR